MNKNLILIVGGGAAAFLAYKLTFGKAPRVPGSYPVNYAPQQPNGGAQGVYPSQPTTAPRVDNQSQPWYNNSKLPMQTFGTGPQPSGLVGLAQQVSAGANIVNSLSDVWGNVSGFFDSGDNVGSADDWSSEEWDYA